MHERFHSNLTCAQSFHYFSMAVVRGNAGVFKCGWRKISHFESVVFVVNLQGESPG